MQHDCAISDSEWKNSAHQYQGNRQISTLHWPTSIETKRNRPKTEKTNHSFDVKKKNGVLLNAVFDNTVASVTSLKRKSLTESIDT